ncbi:hypothetical protein G3573_20440, partial [Caulobacter sp. 17J65-9]|nr:hypothetical protein [Caulobacter sp. 17J65-9]
MRFEKLFTRPESLRFERQSRRIETVRGVVEVEAPQDWTNARVEAWLDWAASLPGDWPANAPASLSPDKPFDPLLAGGPDRYARRLAAWGYATGLFAQEADAELFAEELSAAIASGLVAPAAQRAGGERVHPVADDRLPAVAETAVLRLDGVEFRPALEARLAACRAADLA